jgi:hypothetical protein
LGTAYEAVPGFAQFDASTLPSASDVLLIVSQYLGALEKLRGDNITMQHGRWYWVVEGETTEIMTAAPTKLGRK